VGGGCAHSSAAPPFARESIVSRHQNSAITQKEIRKHSISLQHQFLKARFLRSAIAWRKAIVTVRVFMLAMLEIPALPAYQKEYSLTDVFF